MTSFGVNGFNFLLLLAGCRLTESTYEVHETQSMKTSDDFSANVTRRVVNSNTVYHNAYPQQLQPFNASRVVPLVGRTRRSTDVDIVIAQLNVLGIVISVPSAAAGAPFLIIGALLPLFFKNNDEPVRTMTRIVWNERVENQRRYLIGIQKRLQDIKDHGGDPTFINSRILSLYDDLTVFSCFFMRHDNIRSSAAYFREFATLRLIVNQALILGLRNETVRWKRNLDRHVIEFVAYGNYVIQEDLKVDANSTLYAELSPWIGKWLKQLEISRIRQLVVASAIYYDRAVSFRFTKYIGSWLSCWRSGTYCQKRHCAGADNPMEQGSEFRYNWRCRGEIFWIHSIDDNSLFVKSCSRVIIRYSIMFDSYWWLSYAGWYTQTTRCAWHDAKTGRCGPQDLVWRITAVHKSCGEVITDRDIVDIRNEKDNRPPFWNGAQFTIFRSDVPHNPLKEELPCS